MAKPVLLYDGDCGLCNALVRRLLKSDPVGRLFYAPLQSKPAQNYLRMQGLPAEDFDSLVLVPDWDDPQPGAYLLRTDGALAACAVVGGGWRVLTWFRVLPQSWRDAGYKFIARFRYRIFGEYRPSPLADPAWEQRFLAR